MLLTQAMGSGDVSPETTLANAFLSRRFGFGLDLVAVAIGSLVGGEGVEKSCFKNCRAEEVGGPA
jgi:NhaP-type Na+/H+ and K+/H+ antiporter